MDLIERRMIDGYVILRRTFLNCGISQIHLKIDFSVSHCLSVSKKVEKTFEKIAKSAQKYTVFTLKVERFPKVQSYSKVVETMSKKWQTFTQKVKDFVKMPKSGSKTSLEVLQVHGGK